MYDVIILGSGPAGLTSAIYTTRADLKTLLIAGVKWGGQLQLTTLVENFPGFPEGIQGPDLMLAMRKQAERFGTEFIDEDFDSVDFSTQPFKVTVAGKTHEGKAVIIATGAETKWLEVPGEKEKIGRGVSSCAPCDAVFFRGKNTIVVGGGDSAMEEATVLSKFADSVTIVHRKDSFRASEIMQKRVLENPKIKVLWNSEVKEIKGEGKVEGVVLFNNKTNETSQMPIDGVFVAIGHIPNSGKFKDIETDEAGFIKVHDHYKTNKDGVFVAGDVHDSHYKQAVTAAGYGSAAALEAERWLEGMEAS
ncbi:MAG: thioredoxin-disulfide reductase [Candidatus Levybacteria bacterium RIFCSPLOWO2_01_FULL_36_13]|nr:MAG: thioredoxin-disulfide reductase [Candidatus Levybacteria bacterium RIFCSPHIGHO2_01_FULL_36_15b]OGH34067.1 MAG: thioredoxin-disulfide reductase [Candidatus Levybacteria bacterium RIFCSPLOWO2_01_FULL_36_13]